MLPIERPGKIICVGLNYRGHAEEQDAKLPERPLLFAKWTTSLTGPGLPIVLPPVSQKVDYEAELAVVIGALVNGEVRQDSSTADMIFSVAELIAFASEAITLEPGDLFLTRTPPGVGEFRDPPLYLREGDEVTIEIDGLGALTNPVHA